MEHDVYIDGMTGGMFVAIDGQLRSVNARAAQDHSVRLVEGGHIWSNCTVEYWHRPCSRNGWGYFSMGDEDRAAAALEVDGN
jgi:hypothetical protein